MLDASAQHLSRVVEQQFFICDLDVLATPANVTAAYRPLLGLPTGDTARTTMLQRSGSPTLRPRAGVRA